jgi:hypothetical protein
LLFLGGMQNSQQLRLPTKSAKGKKLGEEEEDKKI